MACLGKGFSKKEIVLMFVCFYSKKHLQPSFIFDTSTVGDGYTDSKDLQWSNDSKLEAVDLNKLDARRFVVYKFGCFVTELVAAHCQHAPVIVLLANKIPPNERLRRNPYRNSFYFDGNNKILYIRAARLECVGEFVVVLVHTLAHIKSGQTFYIISCKPYCRFSHF